MEIKNRIQSKTEDVSRISIPASNHFDTEGHNFNIHTKFILTEQLNQINLEKLTLRKRLKIRETFWILKLETLYSKGLNRKLNKI